MQEITSSSVELVVTSPPYPMIEMWDEMFIAQNPAIGDAVADGRGIEAFELMHTVLDQIWQELHRILIPGGFACINIGDATRTTGGSFSLYANHSRILAALIKTGFAALPLILWRKPTNAPNKFMGSGMLPAGAYVTLEHEYILIVRKGPKREFVDERTKQKRRESAIFWEERNTWFSDVWLGLIGTQQKLKKKAGRLRSGAFPFELAYRLVNMYSTKSDTVVDPFLGTGTTMWASMASGRNCIGYEVESKFRDLILDGMNTVVSNSNDCIRQRIHDHLAYIDSRQKEKGKFKYLNRHYKFPVMTRQETELFINPLKSLKRIGPDTFEVEYDKTPDRDFNGEPAQLIPADSEKSGQLELF